MLTDQQCKTAKATDKPLKLSDGNGLYLHVTTKSHKGWRLKYRFGGKERLIVFGPYPDITLRKAREMRDDARRELREGRDPGEEHKRKAVRRTLGVDPASTFEAVATRWHEIQKPLWKERHASDVLESLQSDAFPAIGKVAIAEVKAASIRALLEAVQDRGALETAHRLRQRISAVFRFAIVSELVDVDPAAAMGVVLRPKRKGRQPALLKIESVRAFLKAFEAEPGHPTVKLASRLLALTVVRPGVIPQAVIEEFEDLDGERPIWRIPAEKMKLRRDQSELEEYEFIVPLSAQAVATVKVAAELARGRQYLFPSARHSHRPITENALNTAYRRLPLMLGRHVPHGWRSTFSTIMNERAIDLARPGDRAIIDLMLAHQPEGVEARYNRAAYLPRRRQLAQDWADMLMDGVSAPSTLTDLKRRTR